MGQRLQPWQLGDWRSGDGEKLWLSMLVATMEELSSPQIRAAYCDSAVLAEVRAQLARPASPYPYGASNFSLRN